jgi:hypothetical protein
LINRHIYTIIYIYIIKFTFRGMKYSIKCRTTKVNTALILFMFDIAFRMLNL